MANPLLESFREAPKAWVMNSSYPPANLKGKETPDLPSVCLNYWPPNVALSLCFIHLVLLTSRQCRSAIPQRYAKPIASIRHPDIELQKSVYFMIGRWNIPQLSLCGDDLTDSIINSRPWKFEVTRFVWTFFKKQKRI